MHIDETYAKQLLADAREYITPTISTHEEITDVLGWCDCKYCDAPTRKEYEKEHGSAWM